MMNAGKARIDALAARAVRLQQREQVTDSIVARGVQHRLGVVYEQGVLGIEGVQLLQPVPEVPIFLGGVEIVGDHHPIEASADIDFAHLDVQRFWMGIGHQQYIEVSAAQPVQKIPGMGTHTDHMAQLSLQGRDVHAQHPGPVLQAVPGQGAAQRFEPGGEMPPGVLFRHPLTLCVRAGQILHPEVVVVVQIQQCAVHIKEHGVDV